MLRVGRRFFISRTGCVCARSLLQAGIRNGASNYLLDRGSLRGTASCIAEPEGCSEEESAEMDLSKTTANRWGVPKADPAEGVCARCTWFRFLDANFYGCGRKAPPA